jgi:hypothetical protein
LSVAGHSERIGDDTAACETLLRDKFGPPEFEDSNIIVFPFPRRDSTPPNASR